MTSLDLEERFRKVRARVPPAVMLLAVGKTKSIDDIEALYRKGHRDFAENYAQELVEKAKQAQHRKLLEIRWHFIGHLQTNKIKTLLPLVASIQTVDSVRLIEALSKEVIRQKVRPEFWIEVNIDQEPEKSGIKLDEVDSFLSQWDYATLGKPAGWMCIPALRPAAEVRLAFRLMKKLSIDYCEKVGTGLSMGMSNDFEVAIEEGSTCVRVGSLIFGERDRV